MIEVHKEDLLLASCRNAAEDKAPSFYHHEEVLMIVFRSPELHYLDTWSTIHQLTVPSCIRISLKELAHDDLYGHTEI